PRPFTYFDKGMMATIGKGRAVLDSFGVHMSGFPAWVVWALIHIAFLINSRSRFTAIWSWSWAYVFNNGINELIIEPEGESEESEDDPGIPAAAPGAAG
ncbi:MAG: NAD(P)/FAD-dependent oxidoreductase, partial [Planctomycetota bacterium]|nr:NAD(P)/FAD-dependent oxidoreductase [Planctomycetota bacterium]